MDAASNADKVYERAELIPLITSGADKGNINFINGMTFGGFPVNGNFFPYGMQNNTDFSVTNKSQAGPETPGGVTNMVHATFIDPNNPDDVDVVWIAPYRQVNQTVAADMANGVNGWTGGFFMEDYVERTLPHIFSCDSDVMISGL